VLALRHRVARPGILAGVAVVYAGIFGLGAVATGRGAYAPQQLVSISAGGNFALLQDLAAVVGADQLIVFDNKYMVFAIALVVLWASAIVSWRCAVESDKDGSSVPVLCVAVFASACGVFLPDVALFSPGGRCPRRFWRSAVLCSPLSHGLPSPRERRTGGPWRRAVGCCRRAS
jgi:hypothetical protein